MDAEIIHLDLDERGQTVIPPLEADTACVVMQYPNFFGVVEDLSAAADTVHQKKGLMVSVTTEAMALGCLKAPGSFDVDIALLPVSGTYVMTAEQAVEAARAIKPKLAIPMHYGAIVGDESDAEKFINTLSGEIDVLMLQQE